MLNQTYSPSSIQKARDIIANKTIAVQKFPEFVDIYSRIVFLASHIYQNYKCSMGMLIDITVPFYDVKLRYIKDCRRAYSKSSKQAARVLEFVLDLPTELFQSPFFLSATATHSSLQNDACIIHFHKKNIVFEGAFSTTVPVVSSRFYPFSKRLLSSPDDPSIQTFYQLLSFSDDFSIFADILIAKRTFDSTIFFIDLQTFSILYQTQPSATVHRSWLKRNHDQKGHLCQIFGSNAYVLKSRLSSNGKFFAIAIVKSPTLTRVFSLPDSNSFDDLLFQVSAIENILHSPIDSPHPSPSSSPPPQP